ncbi:discoidin, CUB and LCCL domain-containing protein 1 isoform X1 [Scyliorhinus canicula]|uniref:discoidin, CUB and LCCL domain-containing protein 1 isoform X1 n=1 Tax=Scyliorhinus canicula TaxID=7830 RepID=UPI0018F2F554|nr:discoidin, CUB and LCCL domain-containing protein 1 isoform X1 [Scyliorhinus canicula]
MSLSLHLAPESHLLLVLLAILAGRKGLVQGQQGDGCGHTVIGLESGTLTSKNYPGTYPNHTFCKWELRVAPGKSIILRLGDLDIEYTEDCSSNSLKIYTSSSANSSYGPYCGNMNEVPSTIQLTSNAMTVEFRSGTHISGRGFLLSYTTTDHSDLISCLDKGIHYSQQSFSKYCPAGCKNVTGDVWGNLQQGYRDTSVLCKAAIHAGAISDDLGGPISVILRRGITLYEAASANGILTKTGPLSEKRMQISKDCSGVLKNRHFSASSSWTEKNDIGELIVWSPDKANVSSKGHPWAWAASSDNEEEWLQIDVGERRNITGIVTKGSTNNGYNFYVKTYKISYSKDGKSWRIYKSKNSKEGKVFEGNTNDQQLVRNNFIPSFVGRYIRIKPLTWSQRIAMKVELIGCKVLQRIRQFGNPRSSKPLPKPTGPPTESSTLPDPVVVEKHTPGFNLMVILIVVGFVVIISAAALLLCLYCKKRKTGPRKDCSFIEVCDKSVTKQNCQRGQLKPTESEIITYTSEEGSSRNFTENDMSEYAEPDIIQVGITAQKTSSTFKPSVDDGYTIPLVVSHYDVPFSGKDHEYAEPLSNPEPEYATPFVEQSTDPEQSTKKNVCIVKVVPATPEAL